MAKKNRVIKNLTGANRVSAKYYNLAIRNKRRSKKDCAWCGIKKVDSLISRIS